MTEPTRSRDTIDGALPRDKALFRAEAVKFAGRRLQGEVVLHGPISLKVFTAIGVSLVMGVVLMASLATYARKETLTGWVVPQGGLIRVVARQPGIIERLDVSEGAEVKAGEPLALLRLSSDIANGDSGASLQQEVAAELAATRAQADATRGELLAKRAQLLTQRAALSRELAETKRRIDALVARADLARRNADRYQEIATKGFLSRRDLEVGQSAALAADQDVAEVRTTALGFERQMGDIDAQLEAFPLNLQSLAAQSRAAEAQLAQKRTSTDVQSALMATATVGGRVVAIPVEQGQSVPTGGVIAILTPAGGRLEAELFAPSRAAGFIRKGQDVKLMYAAFPFQKFGTAHGIVRSVSRTVLAPSEVSVPGLSIQEPVFRVRVQLDRTTVEAYGQSMPLQPGMLVGADVVLDRRSLWEWLLDPLFAAGRRI
ncbi:HlyD family efflux transporter periplasmic adaptor subunit [Caulobacter sp. BE254]|uniref:HlyD family secretion protein n=1 Tax=Caulobacter sp. BE254 TaxID=2817720 RepID=UPI0028541DF1|nr:HlyD family efflux transporter periplasmic adaptor subunit [Caulobacter sp. BE254]MDR7114667.1 membrane fusion protein [Caulobacter sp. BE254]